MLLTTKYVDGLPLARFEYVLARAGVIVPRQTLARWTIGTAQALQPLANLMRDALLEHDLIYMDETPVQVLKEPGRAPTAKSQMWVQRGGPPDTPVVLFDNDPTRSQAVPLRLLEGWKGYLMADALESYNAIALQEGITRLGCWVHARRRFVDAAKLMPAGKTGRAHEALAFIARLYAIEKHCRDKSAADRLVARQTHSRAALSELRIWLDGVLYTVPPSSALGQARGGAGARDPQHGLDKQPVITGRATRIACLARQQGLNSLKLIIPQPHPRHPDSAQKSGYDQKTQRVNSPLVSY